LLNRTRITPELPLAFNCSLLAFRDYDAKRFKTMVKANYPWLRFRTDTTRDLTLLQPARQLIIVVGPRKNFEVRMVQTYGLTHINLAVRDLGRALRFYEQVFGLREYGRGDGLVHTQASGRRDILTFTEDPTTAGLSGGVSHFGFRLVDPDDIDRAIAEVERAGGRLLRRGEFAPGLPYAYVADPDGYQIEIWFE
jgi:catechol 2,3-dioxygenase-like lactoylglutathione lyase family enzyme